MSHKPNHISVWTIFITFLRLGLTSFGGPVAHLGYFRTEFVDQKKWLSDQEYSDLVALCQFLPGPASSQVGLAIGMMKARYLGALAAWLGFTLPSALLLTIFAFGIAGTQSSGLTAVLMGLKIVAVGIVAHAVWGMAQSLCRGYVQAALAIIATATLLLFPNAIIQVGVIFASGFIGWLLIKTKQSNQQSKQSSFDNLGSRKVSVIWLALFFILLLLLPILASSSNSSALELFDGFYRTGALVFGGGHVVLPLLQTETVGAGLMTNDAFLAGYGAAQAVPGPLFTFASFLGAVNNTPTNGVIGSIICLLAIFLPSFFLIAGALPFLGKLRSNHQMQSVLAGVNACVVGILAAALYNPLWTSTIKGPTEFVMAAAAFIALAFLKAPSWLVVVVCAIGGYIFLN